MNIELKQGDRVLFQGDSITDCERDRNDPDALGTGYPMRIAQAYQSLYPETQINFQNRGISGNQVGDVLARCEEDILALRPDVVSILLGINDVWRRYDNDAPVPLERFEHNYQMLLQSIRQTLPYTRIIIMEPFLLHTPSDRHTWREDLDPKIQVVRDVAAKYADTFIPLDGIFARCVVQGAKPVELAEDGVHPTNAGHALIAKAWLEEVT